MPRDLSPRRSKGSHYGLSSEDLLTQVEEGQTINLGWLFAVFRRRLWIMAVVGGCLLGAVGGLIVLKSKDDVATYTGSFDVLIEPITAEGRLARLSLSAQSGNLPTSVTEISKVGMDYADLTDYETQVRVLKSPKIMNPIVEEIQKEYSDISFGYLYQNLILERTTYEKDGKLEGTKIVQVRYQDEDPEKILYILNVIADAYLTYSKQERLASLEQGIDHLKRQLPELQNRVRNYEKQIQLLRETNQLSFPEETAKDLAAQSRDLGLQRVATEAELAQTRANYDNLKAQLDAGNPIPLLLKDISTQQAYGPLISQHQNLEAQLALDSTQFRENSPPMAVLRDKQANIQKLMTEEAEGLLDAVEVKIQDLEARVRYLNNMDATLERQQQDFPKVLREYDDLQRNLAVATESLSTFLSKRENLQLDASQQDIPWELISPPDLWQGADGLPQQQAASDVKRMVMIVGVLSALVGVGAGFVVEILHTVYHTPEEVKADTKLRLLGVIPRIKGKVITPLPLTPPIRLGIWQRLQLPWARFQSARIALYREAFRSLYTQINLLGSQQMPMRSLVISSTSPEDGKSTLSQHLAMTAATIGKRVLLVDADLRNPQLHHRLGCHNRLGLTDHINRDLPVEDVVQPCPGVENLFFLSGGTYTRDPIKILSAPTMQRVMEELHDCFDVVFYNTPPLLGLSDAQLLAAHSDGIILVVRLEKTNRPFLAQVLETLKISGTTVLGVVANDAKNYAALNASSLYHPQYYRKVPAGDRLPS